MAATELYSTPLFNDASLVAYYRMEGNSSDSKNSNNGTDTNITYGSSYGKFNQGALFNALSNRIAILTAGWSSFTLSMWCKPTLPVITADPYYGLYTLMSSDAIDTMLNIHGDGIYKYVDKVCSYDFNNNDKFHLVVCGYDSGKFFASVDGSTIETLTATNSYSGNNIRVLGQRENSQNSHAFKGSMDEVAIFSRKLTQLEINNLYNGYSSSGFFALLGGL